MSDLDVNGSPQIAANVKGRTAFGYDGTSTLPMPLTPGGGAVVTSAGAGATGLGPTPPPTALAPLAAGTPLPVAPPAALFMIVQNAGPAGALIVVKELGGPAGAGITLPRFGLFVFDGSYPLAADNLVAAPGSVQITWET